MAGENSKRWRGAAFNTPSFVLFFVVGGVAGPNRPVGGGIETDSSIGGSNSCESLRCQRGEMHCFSENAHRYKCDESPRAPSASVLMASDSELRVTDRV